MAVSEPPAILVRDLRKSYGDVDAVRGIDFDVARGEVFGLLGPNGAGKTTTVEILEKLGLSAVADRRAAGLPYGTLKRVELARALCGRPKLLMLDEPASGLNHREVDELADQLMQLRGDLDLTILLVEHHMGMVMRASDHVVVLNLGRMICEGAPAEVQKDQSVIDAYLGTAE